MTSSIRLFVSRRNLLKATAGVGAIAATGLLPQMLRARQAPAVIAQESALPQLPYGVASGDLG